jgi:hypothetical protein
VEIVAFLVLAFVVAVFVLWRVRGGGSGEASPMPPDGDRPEAAISNESTIGPHRNVGRPFHVDRGGPPSGGTTEDL